MTYKTIDPITVLETIDLQVGYQTGKTRLAVLEKVNLQLLGGKLTALIGANGSGKSTLMRTLAGVQPPLSGQVQVLARDIAQTDRRELAGRVSVVLSGRVQEEYLTVGALVALGRHPHTGWSGHLSQTDQAKIAQAMAATGTTDWQDRYFGQLSDGQAQKVLVARALAQDTPLMLLDEPTAHLDIMNRVEIMQLLRQLASQHQKSLLVATHDLDIALQTAHEVWVIDPQGKVQTGLPEQLALDGVISRALVSAQVHFDRTDGLFKLSAQPNVRPVGLAGDPTGAFWTKRALEKAGFMVGPATEGAAQVQVAATDQGYRWWVGSHTFIDLQTLLLFLTYA